MHFTSITAAAVSMLAMQAQAKTVKVAVGKGGLKFDPDNIKADKGDTLEFHFYPNQHNVILGNKDKACTPATSGGFFSGNMKVDSGTGKQVFQVAVNSTDPLYIYCGVAKHCESGMTAVVNPASDSDVKSWASAAAAADASINPSGAAAFGGKVAEASSGSSSETGSKTQSGGASATGAQTGLSMTGSPTSGAAATGSQTKAAASSSSAGAVGIHGQMGGAAAAIAGLAAFVL